jgi:formiminotetrahydrofolate cyclodeaminase
MELNKQLLLLPANQLLEKFGAGNHVPGSGSAAALSGILAAKLCLAVAKLTLRKLDYEGVSPEMNFIKEKLEKLEPILYSAFQKDSEVFDEVIIARRSRDKETDPKKRKQFSNQALNKLREATEIPLEICTVCHEICDNALLLFDIGFKSARGDSGAAASSALSGAYAALFICYLNLKQARKSRWSIEVRKKCEDLLLKTNKLQVELFSRVINLRNEGLEPDSIQLEFKF